MLKRLNELLKETRIQDHIFYFIIGAVNAIILSFGLPTFPQVLFFIAGLALLLSIASILAYHKNFVEMRMLFLGGSVTAVISAFITFMSLTNFNLISINIIQIAGVFRSLLLASLFSLIERLTRFVEDRIEAKQD